MNYLLDGNESSGIQLPELRDDSDFGHLAKYVRRNERRPERQPHQRLFIVAAAAANAPAAQPDAASAALAQAKFNVRLVRKPVPNQRLSTVSAAAAEAAATLRRRSAQHLGRRRLLAKSPATSARDFDFDQPQYHSTPLNAPRRSVPPSCPIPISVQPSKPNASSVAAPVSTPTAAAAARPSQLPTNISININLLSPPKMAGTSSAELSRRQLPRPTFSAAATDSDQLYAIPESPKHAPQSPRRLTPSSRRPSPLALPLADSHPGTPRASALAAHGAGNKSGSRDGPLTPRLSENVLRSLMAKNGSTKRRIPVAVADNAENCQPQSQPPSRITLNVVADEQRSAAKAADSLAANDATGQSVRQQLSSLAQRIDITEYMRGVRDDPIIREHSPSTSQMLAANLLTRERRSVALAPAVASQPKRFYRARTMPTISSGALEIAELENTVRTKKRSRSTGRRSLYNKGDSIRESDEIAATPAAKRRHSAREPSSSDAKVPTSSTHPDPSSQRIAQPIVLLHDVASGGRMHRQSSSTDDSTDGHDIIDAPRRIATAQRMPLNRRGGRSRNRNQRRSSSEDEILQNTPAGPLSQKRQYLRNRERQQRREKRRKLRLELERQRARNRGLPIIVSAVSLAVSAEAAETAPTIASSERRGTYTIAGTSAAQPASADAAADDREPGETGTTARTTIGQSTSGGGASSVEPVPVEAAGRARVTVGLERNVEDANARRGTFTIAGTSGNQPASANVAIEKSFTTSSAEATPIQPASNETVNNRRGTYTIASTSVNQPAAEAAANDKRNESRDSGANTTLANKLQTTSRNSSTEAAASNRREIFAINPASQHLPMRFTLSPPASSASLRTPSSPVQGEVNEQLARGSGNQLSADNNSQADDRRGTFTRGSSMSSHSANDMRSQRNSSGERDSRSSSGERDSRSSSGERGSRNSSGERDSRSSSGERDSRSSSSERDSRSSSSGRGSRNSSIERDSLSQRSSSGERDSRSQRSSSGERDSRSQRSSSGERDSRSQRSSSGERDSVSFRLSRPSAGSSLGMRSCSGQSVAASYVEGAYEELESQRILVADRRRSQFADTGDEGASNAGTSGQERMPLKSAMKKTAKSVSTMRPGRNSTQVEIIHSPRDEEPVQQQQQQVWVSVRTVEQTNITTYKSIEMSTNISTATGSGSPAAGQHHSAAQRTSIQHETMNETIVRESHVTVEHANSVVGIVDDRETDANIQLHVDSSESGPIGHSTLRSGGPSSAPNTQRCEEEPRTESAPTSTDSQRSETEQLATVQPAAVKRRARKRKTSIMYSDDYHPYDREPQLTDNATTRRSQRNPRPRIKYWMNRPEPMTPIIVNNLMSASTKRRRAAVPGRKDVVPPRQTRSNRKVAQPATDEAVDDRNNDLLVACNPPVDDSDLPQRTASPAPNGSLSGMLVEMMQGTFVCDNASTRDGLYYPNERSLSAGLSISRRERLFHVQIDGVDYWLTMMTSSSTRGYMRFAPNTQKCRSRCNMQLEITGLFGVVGVTIGRDQVVELRPGDMLHLPTGTKYVVRNSTSELAMVAFRHSK